MPPPFEVRRATHDDVEPALDLVTAVAEEGRWIGTEPGFDRAARAEQRHARIDDPDGAAAFVAVTAVDSGDDDVAGEAGGGDRVIGDLGITLAPYGVADLGMVVAADWRGRGVGSALLAAAVDWARGAGAHKVALQLWPHNVAARGLYDKHGFVEEGYLRRHYRRADGSLWDAVVMGLVLDETTPRAP